MALMLGALLIKGIPPGPQLMINDPPLFWGLIASLWVGNLMLVILNLPLVGIWIKLLTVPYQWVFPAITVFCCIGAYTLGSHGAFNVWLMALFALVGYVFYKLKCECGPLLLGFILGPLLEEELRHALLLSHGDWRVFVASPVSTGLLVTAALMLVLVLLPLIKGKREVAFAEAE
jgi:TctA family transporter